MWLRAGQGRNRSFSIKAAIKKVTIWGLGRAGDGIGHFLLRPLLKSDDLGPWAGLGWNRSVSIKAFIKKVTRAWQAVSSGSGPSDSEVVSACYHFIIHII